MYLEEEETNIKDLRHVMSLKSSLRDINSTLYLGF